MKLWLLRHARVLLPSGLCYGASDVPADEALTAKAAQAIAPLLPAGLPVRVSDLRRAQQLHQALRGGLEGHAGDRAAAAIAELIDAKRSNG